MMEIWIVGWLLTFAMAIYEYKLEERCGCSYEDKIPLCIFIVAIVALFVSWPVFIIPLYKSIRRIQNEKYLDKEIHSKDR